MPTGGTDIVSGGTAKPKTPKQATVEPGTESQWKDIESNAAGIKQGAEAVSASELVDYLNAQYNLFLDKVPAGPLHDRIQAKVNNYLAVWHLGKNETFHFDSTGKKIIDEPGQSTGYGDLRQETYERLIKLEQDRERSGTGYMIEGVTEPLKKITEYTQKKYEAIQKKDQEALEALKKELLADEEIKKDQDYVDKINSIHDQKKLEELRSQAGERFNGDLAAFNKWYEQRVRDKKFYQWNLEQGWWRFWRWFGKKSLRYDSYKVKQIKSREGGTLVSETRYKKFKWYKLPYWLITLKFLFRRSVTIEYKNNSIQITVPPRRRLAFKYKGIDRFGIGGKQLNNTDIEFILSRIKNNLHWTTIDSLGNFDSDTRYRFILKALDAGLMVDADKVLQPQEKINSVSFCGGNLLDIINKKNADILRMKELHTPQESPDDSMNKEKQKNEPTISKEERTAPFVEVAPSDKQVGIKA